MGYKIDDIEGIGPTYMQKLNAAGVRTTDDFLSKCCDSKGRKALAAETGVTEKNLLKWANLADLMRISGVGPQFSELLEAAGVDTVKELRNRNAKNLAEKMEAINTEKKLSRSSPAESVVTKWVQQAKALSPVISH